MPFDGPGAEEELGADFHIGAAADGEPGDVSLLGRELAARLDGPLTNGVAGGEQLTPGPFGERLDAHRGEQPMGGPQLGAGVPAPVLAAQPFAVQEVGAGHGRAHAGTAEPLNRLAIAVLGGLTLAERGTGPRFGAKRPVGAAGAGRLGKPLESAGCARGLAAADGRLDQLRELPSEDAYVVVLAHQLGGGEGLVVVAEAVVQQGGRVLAGHSPPLTTARHAVHGGRDELGEPGLTAPASGGGPSAVG